MAATSGTAATSATVAVSLIESLNEAGSLPLGTVRDLGFATGVCHRLPLRFGGFATGGGRGTGGGGGLGSGGGRAAGGAGRAVC